MNAQPLDEVDEETLTSIEHRVLLDPAFKKRLEEAAPMLLLAVLSARDGLDSLAEHQGLTLGCDNVINVAIEVAPDWR